MAEEIPNDTYPEDYITPYTKINELPALLKFSQGIFRLCPLTMHIYWSYRNFMPNSFESGIPTNLNQ
jgi:hypothetical protein